MYKKLGNFQETMKSTQTMLTDLQTTIDTRIIGPFKDNIIIQVPAKIKTLIRSRLNTWVIIET